jgi:hypothetical protein
MVVFIGTFEHKRISWTSLLWARLIDTLSRSNINVSRNDESFDLQTPRRRSRENESPQPTWKGTKSRWYPSGKLVQDERQEGK